MNETDNSILKLLCHLGICNAQSIVPFYPRTRDRDDISVLQCKQSGVLFLSRSDHMEISHYQNKNDFEYWSSIDRKTAVLSSYEDSHRRYEQFKHIIANKKWLDIGTGAGGILDLLSPLASSSIAVEPQQSARKQLTEANYSAYPLIEDVPDQDFDVVTLFHVFEHLTDPMHTLEEIKRRMAANGKLIIEVPHAHDFLISFLDLDAFKAFTFWSEHLLLHTRQSLTIMLEQAGFTNITISGFQRYPLANHLHWLSHGKPGGHSKWDFLRTNELDNSYADMLAKIDKTDTLIASANLAHE